jgi:hypothetical protein
MISPSICHVSKAIVPLAWLVIVVWEVLCTCVNKTIWWDIFHNGSILAFGWNGFGLSLLEVVVIVQSKTMLIILRSII